MKIEGESTRCRLRRTTCLQGEGQRPASLLLAGQVWKMSDQCGDPVRDWVPEKGVCKREEDLSYREFWNSGSNPVCDLSKAGVRARWSGIELVRSTGKADTDECCRGGAVLFHKCPPWYPPPCTGMNSVKVNPYSDRCASLQWFIGSYSEFISTVRLGKY